MSSRSTCRPTTYFGSRPVSWFLNGAFKTPSNFDTLEWLSRRLDEALSFLNQYLVILAGMRDEWHTSALSRADLPRDTPWKLTLFPRPDDWTEPSGTLDVHATIRDDLPAERSAEEITYAIKAAYQARRGQAPFFQFVELYQAAEHHFGSGRHRPVGNRGLHRHGGAGEYPLQGALGLP